MYHLSHCRVSAYPTNNFVPVWHLFLATFASLSRPTGTTFMLIWHTSCNLFGTLFGSPFGTPFSSPFGTLFGSPFGTPFYSPFGTPFCSPLGTTFSSPFGTPLRRLLGTLFCRPLGASLLQSVWHAVFPIWLLSNILLWHLFARLLWKSRLIDSFL